MVNTEKLETSGTPDTRRRQTKQTQIKTQHVLDPTIRKQTQIT